MLNFSKSKILVIGDIMVDRYIMGKILGLSYEGPIPHIETTTVDMKIGGAGTIVENISRLGANSHIISIVGNDDAGKWVQKTIKKKKIKSKIFSHQKSNTITRNRVMVGAHQLARFDDPSFKLDKKIEQKIINSLKEIVPKVNCIVISDYNKGTLSENIINAIKDLAEPKNKQVIVSSSENFSKYQNPSYIHKIKKLDALKLIKKDVKFSDKKLCDSLHNQLKTNRIILTKGDEGLIAYENGEIYNISPTHHKMRDLTSVGEILIAAFAASFSSGNSFEQSCKIGNVAAGIAVEKIGIKNIEKSELEKELEDYNTLEFAK